jgi:hypothetical protein
VAFLRVLLLYCFSKMVGLRFLVMGLFEKQSVWDTFCSNMIRSYNMQHFSYNSHYFKNKFNTFEVRLTMHP